LRAVENYEGLVPKVHALLEATYIAGLRKACMPEEYSCLSLLDAPKEDGDREPTAERSER
jgi:hypothetical protein